jgi:hypothetical protein
MAKNIYNQKTQNPKRRVNVADYIDLEALNESCSQRRKAKDDVTNRTTIRDVWQHFVDIQEKLIKQRCAPIPIISDSIEIENDKLYVTVDESKNEHQIESILKDILGAEEYNLDDGYVVVDEKKWDSLSEGDLNKIRTDLSECYVELDTTPTINASIDYSTGMGRTDQLSIDELRQLDSDFKYGNLIEGHIEDTAAFISKVSICREDYMRGLFGNHYVVYEKKTKKQKEPQTVELLEYHNEYLSWDIVAQNAMIGLTCKWYTLIFKIKDAKAKEELCNRFDCYYPETDTFEFKRTFTKKDPFHKDFIEEINSNISVFLDEAIIYCPNDCIEVNVDFAYIVSKHQLIRSKFREIAQYLKMNDRYSFNEDTGAIGIDFNWRDEDITSILKKIEEAVPYTKINVFEDHRFKCKVDTKLVGFDDLKAKLTDKYEDIEVSNDSLYHQVKISLPYLESEFYEKLCTSLKNDLKQLSDFGFKVSFAPRSEGKIRLNVNYNSDSKLEDLSDSIEDMKKADFGFLYNDKEITFGKLLKANYPDLVFDIDVDESLHDSVIEAFESKTIHTIVPILTGELEKISRLKNTFTMATTGRELVNPRLQRFIFDSSEATITKDIDNILNKDGYVYKDFCAHLLNERINESQKAAIIKAMYAEDLAVIQGPPGTGKSTAIAELIWQLVRNGLKQGNKRERILLTSETNLAVDNAISRIINSKTNLVKPIRFGDEDKLESEGLQFSIDLMKRWVEEGDSCLMAKSQSDIEDKVNDTGNGTNLILKNWLSNISARSFDGVCDNESDVISRWRSYLNNPNQKMRQIAYNRYVENANVIGATCSSIGDKKAGNEEFNGFTSFYHNYCDIFKQRKGKSKIEFTTVIQDESSKATPAELVLPFVYGHRAIVIGDHRQLPPMLDKEEFEDTLDFAYRTARSDSDKQEIRRLQDFVNTHFDEMEISHFQKLYENIDESLKGSFNLQYRMHPDINEVVEQFYQKDGGLLCGLTHPIDLGVNDRDMTKATSRYHGIDIPGLIGHNTHVLFINTTSPEMQDGTSRVNYGEVETIDKILNRFECSGSFQRYLNKFTDEEEKQIGIISFYGKQIKQLRTVAYSHNSLPIRVSTVDRFQGMERNIVIVSMVRSNIIQSAKDQRPDRKRYPDTGYPIQHSLGFAQSPNRLNVALSRAKRLLVIVGNKDLFSSQEIYRRLFQTIESNPNNKVINQTDL